MVKVTTSSPYGILGGSGGAAIINIEKYPGLINTPGETVRHNIYLHGDLETDAGFDIPIFLEGEYTDSGIHDVEFIFPDKVTMCKMYLWNFKEFGIKRVNGLIVDINDTESLEYAISSYESKTKML